MKQSILMKTKRSINSIMMMLQLLVMLFAMSLGMSSYAQTGSLTVTRTPSTMIAGQPFTIVWSSSEPTAVATKYSCVSPAGGFAGSASLTVSGSASGTADPNWLWKDSTCTWTVVNAAGSVLASRTDIMKTVAAPVNGVTYIHTDGLGSPVAKSDANGNLIAGSRTRYEPYGMTVAGTATPTIGFTGHVNDADTGLTYMQQRYYDPVAGRFLSTDPVLTDFNTGASFNRYTYANNNPYKYIDPDGRNAVTKLIKQTIKHEGNVFKAAADVASDVVTLVSPSSSMLDRAEAAISLVSPIDVGDIKAVKKLLPDFDVARKASFEKAGMTDASKIEFSKMDPKTGTVVEFKGAGGAKVGYDGPHPNTPGAHHDKQHISWQAAGKRESGGAQRGNEPYSGERHPSRPDRKDQ
jgi:RHS repeat-associated protein